VLRAGIQPLTLWLTLLLATALAGGLAGCNLEVERARRDLESRRPQDRVVGLERLAVTEDPAVAPLIEPLLRDSTARVRRAAVAALGSVGIRGRLRKIVDRLEDADLEVRLTAVRVLGDAGKSGKSALLEALRDPSMVVRRAAAEALEGQGIHRRLQVREVARLELQEQITRLRRADDQLRATAARAVGLSGRAAAVAPLVQLLEDRSPLVVKEAAQALGAIGGERAGQALRKMARSKLASDRAAAAGGLAQLGEDGQAPLLRLVADGAAEVRLAAFTALQRQLARTSSRAPALTSEQASKLCAAIADPDPGVAVAASALTRRLPRDACATAVAALIAKVDRTAAPRVEVLARLEGEASTEALLRLAQRRYQTFRHDAVKWLTREQWRALDEDPAGKGAANPAHRGPHRSGVPPLKGAPIGGGQKIDKLLVRFPTRVRGSHVVDPLMPPATSQADVIALVRALEGRPAATIWLARVATEAPAPIRVAALGVRDALRMALRSEVSAVRRAALQRCRRAGVGHALKAALPLLRHKDFELRSAAATCLGRLSAAAAVGPLLKLMHKEHPVAAIQALARIGHHRATQPMAKLLLEDHPAGRQGERVAVVEALGQLGDPAAAPAVQRELGHPDWRVRQAAARALTRWKGRPGIAASLRVCQEDYHAAVRRACGQPARPDSPPHKDQPSTRRPEGAP